MADKEPDRPLYKSDKGPDLPLYNMLCDYKTFMVAMFTVGIDSLMEDVETEIREAMDKLGVRVVLFYAEKLQDVGALMEEWAPVA
jgi:hypothetical protein